MSSITDRNHDLDNARLELHEAVGHLHNAQKYLRRAGWSKSWHGVWVVTVIRKLQTISESLFGITTDPEL